MLLLDISLAIVVLGGSCRGGGVRPVVVVVRGWGVKQTTHLTTTIHAGNVINDRSITYHAKSPVFSATNHIHY